MFDRITVGIKHARVLSTDGFLWVHLPDCGVDADYCREVESFTYVVTVPRLEAIFRQLGDRHLYHGMFCDSVVTALNSWGPAYV